MSAKEKKFDIKKWVEGSMICDVKFRPLSWFVNFFESSSVIFIGIGDERPGRAKLWPVQPDELPVHAPDGPEHGLLWIKQKGQSSRATSMWSQITASEILFCVNFFIIITVF